MTVPLAITAFDSVKIEKLKIVNVSNVVATFECNVTDNVALRYQTGTSLSANMTETPATFGITVGRWR